MNSRTLAHSFSLFFLFFLLPFVSFAQTPDLVPQEYRIKIDDVDVSKAPSITVHATFLDKKSLPVSPKKIAMMEVYADGVQLTRDPDISTLKDSDLPLDLALIVPISQRFSKQELEEMKNSMSHIIDQARKNDRVAGFFDDGRAINVVPLGPAGDVTQVLNDMKPHAQSSFLYSSLDKAIEEMSDPAKIRHARRAIILVTDAFDTYTFRAADVQREIFDVYREARKYDIRIYVVMYKPFIRSLIPLFEGLSRKTGGTYRYTDMVDQIAKGIDFAWGEIYGELFLSFTHSGLRKGEEVVYYLDVEREGGIHAKSNDFPVVIEKVGFNWKKFLIITGIIVGILVIALIVFLIIRHYRRKQEEMEAAIEEQKIQEGIERGEICPKCRRTMMAGWKECMFCAREAAEEINKAKEEKAKAAKAEAEKKAAQKPQGKVCAKCHRTMMPGWTECMFCKAGIGGEGGGSGQGLGPMAAAGGKDKKKEAGEKVCPVCHRTMKPHWTTCLYCEADSKLGGNAGKADDKKKAPEAPAKQEGRVCPNCGRPMKAHWDTCLYCEANQNTVAFKAMGKGGTNG